MEQGKEKLQKLLDYLGIDIPTIAYRTGINKQRFYDINSGKTKNFSPELSSRICETFTDININWLIGGDENLGKKKVPTGSPYYTDFTIQGGLGVGDGLERAIEPSGFINVPKIKCSPSVSFFQVKGDSMLNIENPRQSIPEGSWIALVPEQAGKIQWGRIYAFETSSGPIVKKLMPSEREGCIKCVSFNRGDFPPYDLEVSDIVDGTFCLVVGCVEVHTF